VQDSSESGAGSAGPEADREAGPRFPVHFQILVTMAVGHLIGPWAGKDATRLGELGKVG